MNIWRPFTQENTAPPSLKIEKGEGAYLVASDGTRYLDMISSWWVNIHGHGNKEIADAIAKQAATLEHTIFANFSHEPAEKLVQMLIDVLPGNLEKFFFSDNGSTAVEIAIKMAYQFFTNQGVTKRKKFLSLAGGYHGDTFGAMSLGGKKSKYHATFSDLFFDSIQIKVPEYFDDINDWDENENSILSNLEKMLNIGGDKFCALIVEPLLQGAAGMRLHRVRFLEKLIELVKKYDILVIFDEVMTGFYRTGKMFSFEHTKIIPDIICLSKGLTGGFLPLALTITKKFIFEAFLSYEVDKAFMHGHSYTANPIACAAACKSMELLSDFRIKNKIAKIYDTHLKNVLNLQHVNKKRCFGTMAAFDLLSPDNAKELAHKLMEQGIFIRPLGNVVYLLPPYCITEDEMNFVYSMIKKNL